MAFLNVPVTAADHIQGDEAAPVTLVEYGDYECPHCALADPIIKRVQRHFGEQLRFVFRNFPLQQIHPHAEAAAETAEFAASQGVLWEMHDAIFANQPALGMPLLLELAEALRLSTADLSRALAAHVFAPRVHQDFVGGVRSGVNGTPTLFINGHRHDGPVQLEYLVAAVEAALLPV